MTYADRTAMEGYYSPEYIARLVDADGNASEQIDLDKALAAASSEIDSHVGQRYTVPLTVVPEFIKRSCVDIAIYIVANTADVMSEEITDRYKAAVRRLERIAEGKQGLGEAEAANQTPADPKTGSSSVMIDVQPRVFTSGSMRDV